MTTLIKQKIELALYHLKNPLSCSKDKNVAVEILSKLVKGKRSDEFIENLTMASSPYPRDIEKTLSPLQNRTFVIAVGHEVGAGALGERTWNKKLAKEMAAVMRSIGAKVFIYEHKIKSYSKRQNELAIFCKSVGAFLCWELHYDSFKNKSVAGHHFKFLGAREWAEFTQQEWAATYPQSRARFSKGVHHCKTGAGAGFLRKMPCWALLTEPFFNSNKIEGEFYKPRIKEIAMIYCVAAAKYVNLKKPR